MKYPNFINQVADDLVKLAKVGEEDVVAAREAYVCDLSRAYASLNGTVDYLLTECDKKNPPWGNQDYMTPITQTDTDSLAASAAVGNIDAIHHFSDIGGRALELVTTEVIGTTCLHCFHSPLMAAASTGQFEAVRVLMQLADKDLPAFRERQLDPDNALLDRLEKAITLAIKANNFHCALAILAFARKNVQPSYDHHLRGRTLVRAMKYGCLDVLKSILDEKKSDDSHHTEHSKEGICHVLICGRSNIVRYLLTENLLSFHSKFGLERDHRLTGTPMELAVKFGHSVIIDLLLEAGDVLKPSHIVIALTNILNKKSENMRAAFFTIHHLIKKGAVLDRHSLEVFEAYAGKILRLRYNKEVHVNITNAVMTVVLVAVEIGKNFCREVMKAKGGSIKMVLRLVVNGRLRVPTEPLPFHQLAQEVVEWTQADDTPAGMRKLTRDAGGLSL
jgi:hypothetical protein